MSLGAAVLMDLLAPWPIKIVVDHVLLHHPLPHTLQWLQSLLAAGPVLALAALAASIALLALLSGVFAYAQSYLSAKVGHQIVYALRRELFSHLQRLSLSFHTRARSGELLTKVASDTNLLRDALADWAVKAVAEVLFVVGVLSVMFAMNWRLALVVLATLPLLFLMMMHLNRKIRLSARAQRKQEGRLVSRLNEVLSSISLVQAFGRESYEQARFDIESTNSLEAGLTSARTSAAVSKAVGVISALGMAGTVLVGGVMAVRNQLTPGELLIFIAYVSSIYKPIRDLGKLWAKFSRAQASAERVAEILSLDPEIRDRQDAKVAQQLRGDIEFRDVSFSYEGQPPVLDGASFRIHAGEQVALIGKSGAGKSTLVSLLLRLYEAQGGAVLIDGQPVNAYTRESLRQRIGILLQDTILTGATIRENIAYGRRDASEAQIEQAARQACAHGFIEALADGYDAVVGERGCTLSGGQRQRICLARALIKAPDVLILDEPTSAVDAFTAAVIDQAVSAAQLGKTLIVIGHQFASLQRFDRVLELIDGRVRDVTARYRLAVGDCGDGSDVKAS
ncbi:MAG TPA: ABC transporter ATP-binding protein [Burkholderiales bacterium]|nr:ABC transporter ATP-binding protein [Burkholderiales bacterium]